MLAPPPLSHLSLASFLLGIQEVLCKCILDGRATGAIGVSAGLQDTEVGGLSAGLWQGVCLTFWRSPLQHVKDVQVSPSRVSAVVPSVDPHSLGPAPWDLDKSLEPFCALVSSLRRDG